MVINILADKILTVGTVAGLNLKIFSLPELFKPKSFYTCTIQKNSKS